MADKELKTKIKELETGQAANVCCFKKATEQYNDLHEKILGEIADLKKQITESKEQKSCPFCGSEPEWRTEKNVLYARCSESKRKADRFLHCCGANDVWIDAETWNTRSADTELVDMLEECGTLADVAISSTPTGNHRNLLCDINIKRRIMIDKYRGK